MHDQLWSRHSEMFRSFWSGRVKSPGGGSIGDDECDVIIRILDRNAKGNNKSTDAVARAMIPQGAWRRMFNQFHSDVPLREALDAVLTEEAPEKKARAIDALYRLNEGDKNYLTGPSGNAVGAFLAAYDPVRNVSVISLKDRKAILDHLGVGGAFDWARASIGELIAETNGAIVDATSRLLGLSGSARTVTRFFYDKAVQPLWKRSDTIQLPGRSVHVAVPTEPDEELPDVTAMSSSQAGSMTEGLPIQNANLASAQQSEIRESMQIQALLARIGAMMGFYIWLPKADRARVLKAWSPRPGELLDALPLGYDSTTTKTVEQIDVLWLRRRSIARAFEVEHTTSIYSGLLRMADLVALQPDINVKLHIVASLDRQAKVLSEINRPVFAMLEPRALGDMCTFLSYESIREIADFKHVARLSDQVLEDYEISAADDGDEI